MVFSGPHTILYFLLLLLSPVASVLSQSVDKAATSTISGKVMLGGKGLQGVVVGLVITEPNSGNFRPTRFRATTDEDGSYRITNVPQGNYAVAPASPAYVAIEGRKSLVVGKNETVENIVIELERGGVITGKVTDADGRPMIEEMVYLSATTPQRTPYFHRDVRTDDRGIYRAYGIPPGKYTVSAGRDSSSFVYSRRPESHQRTYHPSTLDPAAAFVIDVSDGSEATNVDITLSGPARTYSARGRIIDSDTNQPMPNTHVGLQLLSLQYGTAALGNVTESTKDGEFKVENLGPGKYAVYSEPPANSDWNSEAVRFEITDRDVDGLVIKISRGASVSGVVILEGAVDAKVRANLFASRIIGQIAEGYLGQTQPSATLSPNGSFRLTGLAAGRLMFYLQPREPFRVIRLERDGIPYPRGVEIKEGEQVTGLRVVVGHANAAIRGVIRLPSGVELPANSRVQVSVRRTDELVPISYDGPVQADARGHFRVDGLIAGTHEIVVNVFTNPPAQSPRIPPARQTVVVTNGAVADVTITLQMPKPAQ